MTRTSLIIIAVVIVVIAAIAIITLRTKTEYSINGQGFEKSSEPRVQTISAIQNVIYYSLVYNPKAHGTIVITLADSSKYTAKNLDGTQFTSILSLLAYKNVQFDTANSEFRLKETIK